MPKNILTYKCLLISPSDVAAERDAAEEAIEEWNRGAGKTMDVRIDCVRWEKDARPDMSGAPQDVINKQLVDDVDMGVAIFWHRLGTPTKSHPSGSVEEIERLLSRNSNMMLYFCERDLPKGVDLEQVAGLRRVRDSFQGRGILGSFNTEKDFSSRLRRDLADFMGTLRAKTPPLALADAGDAVDVAPMPDIRVVVRHMQLIGGGEVDEGISIDVQNHSSKKFFFSGVSVIVSGDVGLFFTKDIMNRLVVFPPMIEPGDAYSLPLSGEEFVKALGEKEPLHALATDKIGRTYKSEPGKLKEVVESLRRGLASKASDGGKGARRARPRR